MLLIEFPESGRSINETLETSKFKLLFVLDEAHVLYTSVGDAQHEISQALVQEISGLIEIKGVSVLMCGSSHTLLPLAYRSQSAEQDYPSLLARAWYPSISKYKMTPLILQPLYERDHFVSFNQKFRGKQFSSQELLEQFRASSGVLRSMVLVTRFQDLKLSIERVNVERSPEQRFQPEGILDLVNSGSLRPIYTDAGEIEAIAFATPSQYEMLKAQDSGILTAEMRGWLRDLGGEGGKNLELCVMDWWAGSHRLLRKAWLPPESPKQHQERQLRWDRAASIQDLVANTWKVAFDEGIDTIFVSSSGIRMHVYCCQIKLGKTSLALARGKEGPPPAKKQKTPSTSDVYPKNTVQYLVDRFDNGVKQLEKLLNSCYAGCSFQFHKILVSTRPLTKSATEFLDSHHPDIHRLTKEEVLSFFPADVLKFGQSESLKWLMN
ncbi:hypothetical protein HDU85_003602 [Gaertneriomyces sp. JEL0708]|nr:hypothetical protein HDU85_003602 [Gaertneriomyces sp. JEL0708]